MRRVMVFVGMVVCTVLLAAPPAFAVGNPWNLYTQYHVEFHPFGWINTFNTTGADDPVQFMAQKPADTDLDVIAYNDSVGGAYQYTSNFNNGGTWGYASAYNSWLTDGLYHWKMRAIARHWYGDDYGNWVEANDSNGADFGIDRQVPEVPTVTSSTHPASWSNNLNAAIGYSATDPLKDGFASGITGYAVNFTSGAAGEAPTTQGTTSRSASHTFPGPGVYFANVRAFDTAGNYGATAHYVFRIDQVAPLLSATATKGTRVLTSGSYVAGTIVFSGTSSDADSGLWHVTISDGASKLTDVTSSPYTLNWNTAGLSGKHVVTVRAYDQATNSTLDSKVFYVDNYRPRTYASRTAVTIRRGGTAKLYWKVYDPAAGGKASVSLDLQRYYSGSWHLVKRVAYGVTSIPSYFRYSGQTLRTAGLYRYRVRATDRAGNTQYNVATSANIRVR